MNWIKLEAKDLNILREHKSILVFRGDSWEYPYDIVQYGEADESCGIEEEFWHSYLHINSNQYEYSTQDLLEDFSHYLLIVDPVK